MAKEHFSQGTCTCLVAIKLLQRFGGKMLVMSSARHLNTLKECKVRTTVRCHENRTKEVSYHMHCSLFLFTVQMSSTQLSRSRSLIGL